MLAPGSYILLTKRISEEESQFVAICDELGIASCGTDLDDAHSHLDEAITLLLNRLTEMGEIESYLMDRSIEVLPPEVPNKKNKKAGVRQFKHVSLRDKEWLTSERVQVPALAGTG